MEIDGAGEAFLFHKTRTQTLVYTKIQAFSYIVDDNAGNGDEPSVLYVFEAVDEGIHCVNNRGGFFTCEESPEGEWLGGNALVEACQQTCAALLLK